MWGKEQTTRIGKTKALKNTVCGTILLIVLPVDNGKRHIAPPKRLVDSYSFGISAERSIKLKLISKTDITLGSP
jgi:hypothetical protein